MLFGKLLFLFCIFLLLCAVKYVSVGLWGTFETHGPDKYMPQVPGPWGPSPSRHVHRSALSREVVWVLKEFTVFGNVVGP